MSLNRNTDQKRLSIEWLMKMWPEGCRSLTLYFPSRAINGSVTFNSVFAETWQNTTDANEDDAMYVNTRNSLNNDMPSASLSPAWGCLLSSLAASLQLLNLLPLYPSRHSSLIHLSLNCFTHSSLCIFTSVIFIWNWRIISRGSGISQYRWSWREGHDALVGRQVSWGGERQVDR